MPQKHGQKLKNSSKSQKRQFSRRVYRLAGALLLDQQCEKEASVEIVRAIEKNIVNAQVKTYDMGGSNTTSQVGDDIARLLN